MATRKEILPPERSPLPPAARGRRMSVYRPSVTLLQGRGALVKSGASSEHSGSTRTPAPSSVRYKNTYKMSPDEEKRFLSCKVEYAMKDILEAYLRKVKYDPLRVSKLCQDLCAIIKSKTKEFEFPRYRLVTQVFIGQDSDQSVQVASRCLWNQDTDSFAAATYRNDSLYAVAIAYGIYLD